MILLMDNFLEQQVVGKSRNSAIKTSNGEEHKNTSKRNNINPDLTSLQNFARVNFPALPSWSLFSQAGLNEASNEAGFSHVGSKRESRNREERNMKRSKSTKKQSVTESSRIQRTTNYYYCRREAGTDETLLDRQGPRLTSISKWVGEPDLDIAVNLKRAFDENGNDL